MSFFTASTSSSSYADHHPFSYSVRRPSALSRVGTTVLDAILPGSSRHNANNANNIHASLHDQALTAQPPVLKRSAIMRQRQGRSASSPWISIAQDVMIHVALVVAAGFVTRYVVSSLWHFNSTHQTTIPKTDDSDNNNDEESS